MSIFSKPGKGNVIRVGVACLVAASLLVQVADTVFPLIDVLRDDPRWTAFPKPIGMTPSRPVAFEVRLPQR